MNDWFDFDGRQWWVDVVEPPPSVHERHPPVRLWCHDRCDAEVAVNALLGDDLGGLRCMRLLEAVGAADAIDATPVDERRLRLAMLVSRGTVRIWWRSLRGHEGRGKVWPVPPAPPPTPPKPGPPKPVDPDLSWYQFIVQDELGSGLAGVIVDLTTPAGMQTIVTDDSGSARIDQVPKGQGAAAIDLTSLAHALQDRAKQPRRTSKLPPETAAFKVTVPSRAGSRFSFANEQPFTVMVVSRTDVSVAGSDPRWRDLALTGVARRLCHFSAGDLDSLAIVSRGKQESARVEGKVADPEPAPDASGPLARITAFLASLFGAAAPAGLVQPSGPWPSEPADPHEPYLDVAIDPLHEALFDSSTPPWDQLAVALAPAPAPAEPDWGSPDALVVPIDVLAAATAAENGMTLEEWAGPATIDASDEAEREGPPED